MQSWQMREAKTKLSELVTLAREVGPQAITRRGKPVAVLVSIDAFKLLSHQGESLAAFMQRSPLVGWTNSISRAIQAQRGTGPINGFITFYGITGIGYFPKSDQQQSVGGGLIFGHLAFQMCECQA